MRNVNLHGGPRMDYFSIQIDVSALPSLGWEETNVPGINKMTEEKRIRITLELSGQAGGLPTKTKSSKKRKPV